MCGDTGGVEGWVAWWVVVQGGVGMGGRGVRGAGWRAGADEGKVLTLLHFMYLFYNLQRSLPSSGMCGNR